MGDFLGPPGGVQQDDVGGGHHPRGGWLHHAPNGGAVNVSRLLVVTLILACIIGALYLIAGLA